VDRFTWQDCVLDAKQHTLTVQGKLVQLAPRYFAVLLCLLRHAGKLVTKNELLEIVWGGHVSEASLHVAIGAVRRALKCGRDYPIETVSTVGYRFVGKVE
jgi:DNA-binding winged helix-turn-helix (wHTH) protein